MQPLSQQRQAGMRNQSERQVHKAELDKAATTKAGVVSSDHKLNTAAFTWISYANNGYVEWTWCLLQCYILWIY